MIAHVRVLATVAILAGASILHAQAPPKVRTLSNIINHPSLNLHAPFISADANAVVFVSDNAEDRALTPFYSRRDRGDWSEPKPLPRNVHTRLNFLRGYGLNADGSNLYISTIKGPGVGGYDLWRSEWRGAWANPENLGAPINSRLHEACPSVTPDGKTMYFMRCGRMNQMEAGDCAILRIDRLPNGQWGTPEELPEHINTGNSQTPRIMADARTLFFASDRLTPSSGGMDLYLTRLENGRWSTPVPLDFVNTEMNDQYASVSALGRYLLRDSKGDRNYALVEYLIPDHLRPRGMTKVEGRAVDETGDPVQGYVTLVDQDGGNRVYNARTERDGTFRLYAMEGSRYTLTVDPEFADRTWFIRFLDLTQEPIPQIERVHAVIKPLPEGDSIVLETVTFREASTALDATLSEPELQRAARLINGQPEAAFEIIVDLAGYRTDSLQTDPDLTETRVDTVLWKYIDIDSLGQLYEKDTFSLDTVYHNDRTLAQAEAVAVWLSGKGVAPDRLLLHGRVSPAVLPENRKTRVILKTIRR